MEQKELKRLIGKAVKGDKRAFEKLYKMFLKSILFSVSNQLDDASRVEDVAQDIVCEMYKRIGTLKAPEAFRSWMHTIIRRMCYDANIKAKKRSGMESVPLDGLEETLKADDEYSEPYEAAEKSFEARSVREIISKLPRARKQVIIMYYYDGLNDREIAEALGVSRSTVKTNLMRAREAIGKAMGHRRDTMGIDGGNKMNEDKTAESLGGVALAPIIIGALKSEADMAFPAKMLASFGARLEHAVHAIPDASRLQSTHHVGSSNAGVIAATAVFVAVTIGAVTVPAPEVPPAYEPPQASIEFVSNEQSESLNPSSVSINIKNDWKAVSWQMFKDGEAVADGTGEFGGTVGGLSPGQYRIEWSIEDPNGSKATVGRDFVIQ
ncbi:MAG: RNA polymerase sigma factor [Clostridiales Family XIII bacterium]|nr:RNA polymerase sigma factor [Clostridiales Family XIII bacterium]